MNFTGPRTRSVPVVEKASRFTRTDLRNARVVGQVDRKFIACVIDSISQRDEDDEAEGAHAARDMSLVLIDQHAADERVRVELFMDETPPFMNGLFASEPRSSHALRFQYLSSDLRFGLVSGDC